MQRVDGLDGPGEHWNGDHLGDFVAGAEFDNCVSEVGHEDENLAAVAGIDDSGSGGDAFGCHGRAVADQQAEGDTGFRMTGLDGDSRADADGLAGSENRALKGEKVVAEVFAGMGNLGSAGGGVEKLDAEHEINGRA